MRAVPPLAAPKGVRPPVGGASSSRRQRVTFCEHLETIDVGELLEAARTAAPSDVEHALTRERLDALDFACLLSPAASSRLEDLARKSHETTIQRFGRTIQLFAPLYISNECVETCSYCSFSRENPIRRRTLTEAEVLAEARLLRVRGFRHLLLVSGEHPRLVSPQVVERILQSLAREAASLSVELQPQSVEVYRRWVGAGAEGLVVYQETYDREAYARVHLAGKKKDYDWRLSTPERGGEAGFRRIGIGALFGLADWRFDAIHLALHARYLVKRFWRAAVTVSLPRLKEAAFAIPAPAPLPDRDLMQLVCAFRLLLPDVGIVLSTREPPALRDLLLRLGVTLMSAGSRTEPGGYSAPDSAEGQFSIGDPRAPEEVVQVIRESGYDPIWKDSEIVLNG